MAFYNVNIKKKKHISEVDCILKSFQMCLITFSKLT